MDLVSKQREERKRRILREARRLIAECGFEGVTMRSLADVSLVSVPTLYNLFGGKNELLFAAVEVYFAELLGKAESEEERDGLGRLMSVCTTLGRQMLGNGAYARSLMVFFGGAQESSQLRQAVANRLSDRLEGALCQMQSEGQIVSWIDPKVLGERLACNLIMTAFEWGARFLADESLEGAIVVGSASMVYGFAQNEAADELQRLIREHQSSAGIVQGSRSDPRRTGSVED